MEGEGGREREAVTDFGLSTPPVKLAAGQARGIMLIYVHNVGLCIGVISAGGEKFASVKCQFMKISKLYESALLAYYQ